MNKEFNLSKKIEEFMFRDLEGKVRKIDGVTCFNLKEFIKQETWLLQAYIQEEITWEEMCKRRLKLIGDKLTGAKQDEN